MRRKGLLAAALIVLAVVLAVLIHLYVGLTAPSSRNVASQPGIKPLFSIYGYGKKKGQFLSKPYWVTGD
jgi:hypothetical protein